MSPKSGLRSKVGALAGAVGFVLGLLPVALNQTTASAAAPDPVTGIHLKVISGGATSGSAPYNKLVHKGDVIPAFKWLISDDSGTGNPAETPQAIASCLPTTAKPLPAALPNTPLAKYNVAGTLPLSDCPWPSVHAAPGHAAVVASGSEADVARMEANLPAGRYLVSVTALDFKIDGSHFTIDANHNVTSLNGEGNGFLADGVTPQGQDLVVTMNPLPKKTNTIRVHVFNDNASTNGQWDGQTETLVTCSGAAIVAAYPACNGVVDPLVVADPATDMSGFVAHMTDVLAEVTTDVYGNPLCTEYVKDASGNVLLADDGTPTPVTFADNGVTGSQLHGTESLCISDHYGDIEIPNMGPNRYAVTVVAPDPTTQGESKWIETTTLEGGHDWDTWNQEGATGYDTELIVGGERVTPVTFGFVKQSHNDDLFNRALTGDAAANTAYYSAAMPGGAGVLTGALKVGRAFIGATGPSALAGTNLSNAKADGPIEDGIVSVNCLAGCTAPTDSAVWVGRAKPDGTFAVTGLQTGDYGIALWDETQSYILATLQYHVDNGLTTQMTDVLLSGWFTDIQGSIFIDTNGNGIRDANESGVPDFFMSIRTRGNSLIDQGAATSVTNDEGHFDLAQGYPLGQFLILEAYNPRFRNTGYTYKTDNDVAHTVLTSQVDINFLPVIGLSANIDWGVQPYDQGTNGGIAGTVTYDATRNELNPRQSFAEDYQPSVSGIPMQLWGTSKTAGVVDHYTPADGGAALQIGVTAGGASCTRGAGDLGTDAVNSGQSCKPLGYYTSESWTRPTGCVALDVQGNKLAGEQALPPAPATPDYSHSDPANPDCIEGPMNGLQIGGDGTVDGNYAFGATINAGSSDPSAYDEGAHPENFSATLAPADYVVEAVRPVDTVTSQPGDTRYLYDFTDETAINIATGDTYVPEKYAANGQPAGVGTLLDIANRKIRVDKNSLATGRDAACVGGLHTVPANNSGVNPDLEGIGGSPYAGDTVPTCGDKLVTVVNGRSTNPTFFMYTPVPLPTKFYGLINDDLNVQTDRRSIMLGEVAPVPNGPVGVYDELGNRKFTAHSDPNGFYEVLLPSTDTYNCPLPAGPCPNVYRLVGNDPGTLDHPNADYSPQFRTIGTEFQGWPGVVHPVDQAPTHIGITIEGPAAQFGAVSLCKLESTNPVIYRIDRPYYVAADDAAHVYTLQGTGFGAKGGLTLTNSAGVATAITTATWSNTAITFTVPALPAGPYQLAVRANGLSTVNGLTFHLLGAGYLTKSDIYEVKPDATNDTTTVFTPQHDAWDNATDTPAGFSGVDKQGVAVNGGRAIQRAIEAAHGANGNAAKLIVIYPNTAPNYASHNAFAAYFENLVLHGKVKLQGVGPGGLGVNGTTIDAALFWAATQIVPAGANQQTADGNYSDEWRTFAAGINKVSTTDIPEGQAVLALAESQNQYGGNNAPVATNLFRPGVDAMTLTGGDQQGFPNNIPNPPGAAGNGTAGEGAVVAGPAQGGAVTLDQYVRDFAITNNEVRSNGGTYGTLRIGTPDLPVADNHNNRLNVANNRIVANGGTNLAGALGIFAGTDDYKVTGNDFCGNFSAEYGGAISHYGLSPNGLIKNNRIYYNQGYDEGGGIMIAGQLPAANATLSPGAGAVTIDGNFVEANLSNDDGGGIRFLMAGAASFDVVNNVIANNVSTHEGGGLALDDAPNVILRNNTIVKNITTATAATSDHLPTPAGLSTGRNSIELQATLPVGSANYSNPVLLNNLFADNRAGTADIVSGAITGIGSQGDATPIQRWDVGSSNPSVGFDQPLAMTASTVNSEATGGALPRAGALSYDSATTTGDRIGATVDGAAAIGFVHAVDFAVDSLRWRVNTNVSFPVIVAVNSPVTKLTDYHLNPTSSYAINLGANTAAAPNAAVLAPTTDIDSDARPSAGPTGAVPPSGYERGADELGTKADLAIVKTDNVGATRTVQTGSVITYTLTATNFGPNAVNNAVVADVLPAGLTGTTWACTVSGIGSCVASGSGNINTLVTLASGSVATLTVTATVAPTAVPGPLVNTANITVPAGITDPDLTNNSSQDTLTVVALVNLSITKTDNATNRLVNRFGTFNYSVIVRNGGPATARATVADVMPVQLADRFFGLLPVGWICAGTGGATCATVGGLGTINQTVTIPPAGAVTFTVLPRVRVNAASGPFVNTATVTPLPGYQDTSVGNDSASDTVTIRGSGNLAITKAVTPTGNVVRGGAVTYTVTVTNTGSALNDVATGAVVTDVIPSTISGATWSCSTAVGSSCGVPANGSGNINQAVNVATGVPVTFTISGTVAATAPLNGLITNTANVAAPTSFNDVGGANSVTVTNTVRPTGDLKTVAVGSSPTTVPRGGTNPQRTVVFTYTLSNAAGADQAITSFAMANSSNLTNITWSCTAAVGVCGAATGSGRPNGSVITLAGGASATVAITARVATGLGLNTVVPAALTLNVPGNYIDPVPTNNTATATVTAV